MFDVSDYQGFGSSVRCGSCGHVCESSCVLCREVMCVCVKCECCRVCENGCAAHQGRAGVVLTLDVNSELQG